MQVPPRRLTASKALLKSNVIILTRFVRMMDVIEQRSVVRIDEENVESFNYVG